MAVVGFRNWGLNGAARCVSEEFRGNMNSVEREPMYNGGLGLQRGSGLSLQECRDRGLVS